MVYACALVLLVSAALWWVTMGRSGTRITAYFTKAVGVYAGSEVKVLGIGVGRIDDVSAAAATGCGWSMTVDDGVEIPADAQAVVVAP